MKIEMGESLAASWLKHCKQCQIVQTNWKASFSWPNHDERFVKDALCKARALFAREEFTIFNSKEDKTDVYQTLMQTECDVLGISMRGEVTYYYMVESAFHAQGLHYGESAKATAEKVAEKFIRNALAFYYFVGKKQATVVFASPVITKSYFVEVKRAFDKVKSFFDDALFRNKGICFDCELLLNEPDGCSPEGGGGFGKRFTHQVFLPIVRRLPAIDDTSELFVRALSMNNICMAPCDISGSCLRRALRILNLTFDEFLERCDSWVAVSEMVNAIADSNMRSAVIHYVQFMRWNELSPETRKTQNLDKRKIDRLAREEQQRNRNEDDLDDVKENRDNRNTKARLRIPQWATKPHVNPYKVIRAFLLLAGDRDLSRAEVRIDDIKNLCSDEVNQELYVRCFKAVWDCLKTDKGNAYGRVFEVNEGMARLVPEVRDLIVQYREQFLVN